MYRDIVAIVAIFSFLYFAETYSKYDTALAGVAFGYFFGRFCTSTRCSVTRREKRSEYLAARRSSSDDSDASTAPHVLKRADYFYPKLLLLVILFIILPCVILYYFWNWAVVTAKGSIFMALAMFLTPFGITILGWYGPGLMSAIDRYAQSRLRIIQREIERANRPSPKIRVVNPNDPASYPAPGDPTDEIIVERLVGGGGGPPEPEKKKKRNRRKKKKAAKQQQPKSKSPSVTSTYKGFTSVVTSPWRKLTFTLQVKATLDRWTTVGNEAVQKAIYDHLGFKPDGESYLEVKYHRVTARNNTPGSALALKIFNILSVPDTEYNAMRSIESYARDSTTYPQCSLSWDSVSRSQALNASETAALFSIFPHIQTDFTVLKFDVMYRHAQTPFADSLPFGLDHELAVLSIDSD